MPNLTILAAAMLLAGSLTAAPARAADYSDPPDALDDFRPAYGPRYADDTRDHIPRAPCLCRPGPEILAYPSPRHRPPVTVETYARPTPSGGWAYGARATGYGAYGPVTTGYAGYAAVDPYTGALYRRQTNW